jgi:outer membrane protein OmpA-like peptidoglycan-associated protein/Tol biopolymer transport system component
MDIRKIVCVILCLLRISYDTAAQKPVAKQPPNDSVKITITNLTKTINSTFPDFAPVISADGQTLVFTSRRPYTEKEIKKGKQGLENVYISYYDIKKKKWADAKPLPETINEPGRYNSAIALSNDGQKMLLYRDDASGNGDIYESQLQGERWTMPFKFPEPINSKDHESSASFSPDGNSLYFVSNRKGGQGGRDIWMCRKENNKWGAAENLGSIINTKEDEETVFLHPDGKTIYFSSKGHDSNGGYDIYRSVFENTKWSQPVNMSHLNTIDDDVCFVLAADGQTGFYSSDKAGGLGDKDIYEVKFTPLKAAKTKQESGPQLTLLKGLISDEMKGVPLEAGIEIIDNEKNKVITTINSNNVSGRYMVSLPSGINYGIIVKAKGYLFHSENVNIPFSAGYQEVIRDVKLKKIEVGKTIVLNNIFYDFDKASLRSESLAELERLILLLNDNSTMSIEIVSHTDNKGTDEYNRKLSQMRAQSVVDYLVEKGIGKQRLTAKGYGETLPVATNETDEGRQQNRRTEFRILSK